MHNVQKGLGNETNIEFYEALMEVRKVVGDLKTGIHHVIYKRAKVYSGKASLAGEITKLAFFIFDASMNKLIFCGFLRTRLKHHWRGYYSRGQVLTGITLVQANSCNCFNKTKVLEVK